MRNLNASRARWHSMTARSLVLRNGMSVRERLLAMSSKDHFYTHSVVENAATDPRS
jgi:hypothetical protein